ncbi:MAG TPA: energy-coupling factor transporter transmembrane protein EcfT [Candidatus Merdibacter merdigallinarum]|nr:energy-coupling factor transporter transmembrane protein EcfT [Candidatus Merdibacter merdigallinarum]
MMEKIMQKLSDNILDKLSMDFLRNQVLKNAYGNDDTFIAKLDPRVLLVWYVFFALVPWFVDQVPFLLGAFLLVAATTVMARVAGLVLLLFVVGVFSQTGYLFLVSLLFGGNSETILPLLILTLKVATVSLASVTVFSGLDPDRLSNGLMWFGCPERLSFSISYAYRMLPMLMEEFQNVLLSYRLRGNAPDSSTFIGKIRYLIYQIKVIIHAFYPLMLNTAKRSRTTVEALEIKGYRNAAVSPEVKKLKLSSLKVGYDDLLFVAVSFLWMALTMLAASMIG